MSEEKISKALEIKYEASEKPKEVIVDKKQLSQMKRERREQLLNTDFDSARDGIKDLINTGMDAVDGIMKVATAGDSPRAYEVAATLLKTISDMNKDLLEIHKQANEAEKDKISVKNTTNNSIYVGSTTDLQNLLNKSRSQFKSEANDDSIIDVEGEEDAN
jgi:glycogen debranching enzyme